jgi:hypothetical protein
MGQCRICGTRFVGTPENPPLDGLCHYCERKQQGIKIETLEGELTVAKVLLQLAMVELDDAASLREEHARSVGVRDQIRDYLRLEKNPE